MRFAGRAGRYAGVVAGLMLLSPLPAASQVPIDSMGAERFEPLQRPAERTWPRPPLEPADPPKRFALPPMPEASPGELGRQETAGPLRIQRVSFYGQTVLSTEVLEAEAEKFFGDTASPGESRTIDAAGLEALRRRITELYVERGYVNSGAIIPPQEVGDGHLAIEIVEGRVAEIRIKGLRHYREATLRDRIAPGLATPFRIHDLEEQMRLLNQDPRIERISARLRPGAARSEAILEILVEEKNPRQLVLGADNHEPRSAGAFAGRLGVGHQNVVGLGDPFRLDVMRTEGATRLTADYALPVHASGTRLLFGGSLGIAELVNNPFRRLEIESRSYSASLGLGQTLYRSARNALDASLVFERRSSRTSLLGRGFSFTEGPENGRSEISVFRGIGEWTHRRDASILAFRSTFSFGTKLLNPTRQRSSRAPDGLFFSWLGQLRGVYREPTTGTEFRLRGDLQLSDRSLLPLEQFSIGGPGSVRGYRRNQLVRDQGFSAALDVRIPIWRSADARPLLTLGPFVDVGRAWNRDRVTPGIRTLSSLGAGLEWAPLEDLIFELEYAYGIRDVERTGDLQDESIYFKAVWRAF